MTAFVISLREGLEAALIVGILLSSLAKLNRQDLNLRVWAGVIAAVGLSAAAAAALSLAGLKFEGRAEEIFEGVTLLLAAAFLTGMIFWMHRHGPQLKGRLETDVRRAAGSSRAAVMVGAIAFLAVLREGIELALLLVASAIGTSTGSTLAGAVLGLAASVILGVLLFSGIVRLNFKLFFRVTNILLIVFAAGMVGLGIHELIEAGLVPALMDPIYDINPVLNDKSTFGELLKNLLGYNGNPAMSETAAYAAYITIVSWLIFRPERRQVLPAPT